MSTLIQLVRKLLLAVSLINLANAFVISNKPFGACHSAGVKGIISTSQLHSVLTSPPPAASDNVIVLEDASAVGRKVRDIVQQAAAKAIAEKGHFNLAIPGGSILNMLSAPLENGADIASKTTIAYVNHKCVSMDDIQLATHAKARSKFLDEYWPGVNVIVMDGTADGPKEAEAYQAKLEALDTLPRNDEGLPVFDLSLIGFGDDGHIGSLYPDRDEVLETTKWVVSVAMKDPPSISLSLPVMTNSEQVVVAACGVSEKYPQGKSDGTRRAIASPDETLQSFPACGLRGVATWVLDKAAASKLGDEYA